MERISTKALIKDAAVPFCGQRKDFHFRITAQQKAVKPGRTSGFSNAMIK